MSVKWCGWSVLRTLASRFKNLREVFFMKYIALSQREMHTAPLPRRVESEYREPQFLWVYSLIALGPDGIYEHSTTYSVKPSYEQANDAGWSACFRDYPEGDGFTQHSVSMRQVHPHHVAKATGGLA